jgi:hypothetical protein
MLFRAEDVEGAFALAESENVEYLRLNPTFQRIGESVAFEIAGGLSDLNEAEIWSGLSRSELSPEKFYEQRYTPLSCKRTKMTEPANSRCSRRTAWRLEPI